jgi:hypothetical protein
MEEAICPGFFKKHLFIYYYYFLPPGFSYSNFDDLCSQK